MSSSSSAIAEKAYKNKNIVVKEYRHRAIIWGVQSHFYFDFLIWLQNCWGILPLTDADLKIPGPLGLSFFTDMPPDRMQAFLTRNARP